MFVAERYARQVLCVLTSLSLLRNLGALTGGGHDASKLLVIGIRSRGRYEWNRNCPAVNEASTPTAGDEVVHLNTSGKCLHGGTGR